MLNASRIERQLRWACARRGEGGDPAQAGKQEILLLMPGGEHPVRHDSVTIVCWDENTVLMNENFHMFTISAKPARSGIST